MQWARRIAESARLIALCAITACDRVGPPPPGTTVVPVRPSPGTVPTRSSVPSVTTKPPPSATITATPLPDAVDAIQTVPGCRCGTGYQPVALAEPFYRRSLEATRDRRFADALDAASRATSVGMGEDTYENQLAISLFNVGRIEEALRLWQQIADEAPDGCELGFYASALLEVGRLQESVTIARRHLEQCPESDSSYHTLSMALEKLGDLGGALAAARAGCALKPDDADCHHRLASVLWEMKRYREARTPIRTAAQLDPTKPNIQYFLSLILEETDDLDGALAAAREAGALEPDNVKYAVRQGDVLRDMERYRDAIRAYDRALGMKAVADGLYGRAMCLHNLGEDVAALRDLKKLDRLFPNYMNTRDWIKSLSSP